MRTVLLIALAACGRVGFEPVAGSDGVGDGGRDGAAPDVSLAVLNRVFITSTAHRFDIDIAEADTICMQRASAAGLPGTFRAWLSSSTVDAGTRLGTARGFVRIDGLPFADTVGELLAGRMFHPVGLTELGSAPTSTRVRTATDLDGTRGVETCGDWTNTAPAGPVEVGHPNFTHFEWTADQSSSAACNDMLPHYCIQIDHVQPLTVPAATGRKAFLSRSLFAASTGVAAADSLCMTDASTFGIPGTFAALLSTQALPAASRFSTSGTNWSRIDGIPLADDPVTAMTGTWKTSLNVDAGGAHVSRTVVYTGGRPDQPGTSTCGDWTTTGSLAGIATPNSADPFASTGVFGCAGSQPVFCFEL